MLHMVVCRKKTFYLIEGMLHMVVCRKKTFYLILVYCIIYCKYTLANIVTDTLLVLRKMKNDETINQNIRIVFSDLDGTLIHYPKDASKYASEHSETILQLPPSATGTKGVISARTLLQTQELRQRGVKLVLISGMRTSTLISRLPFLPEADAYCTEAGGRIFYRVPPTEGQFQCQPVHYEGAGKLEKFGLKEDMEWRKRWEVEGAAGKDGFKGNEITLEQKEEPIPIQERSGLLWEFAARLERDGLVVDSKSYSTCFRVNRSQQTKTGEELFDDLFEGKIPCPTGLATSTNLGAVDFYPAGSGKKNCCEYLATTLYRPQTDINDMLSHCVCICDDDNDIEMALACSHAFVPSLHSASMEETIRRHPSKFTKTFHNDSDMTRAAEKALELILSKL